MRRILETGLLVVAAFGFFGFVYPELCLIEDTCQAVEEEEESAADLVGSGKSQEGPYENVDIARVLGSLPPDKIRIKSRLFEYLFGSGDNRRTAGVRKE